MNKAKLRSMVQDWNRKLHFYFGLFLLLFLWLFSFSGLLLNHPKWEFAQFWPQREVTMTERRVRVPAGTADLAIAQELMTQLELPGEFQWTKRLPQENELQLRMDHPGEVVTVTANLTTGRASIETIRFNVWGILRNAHTFTGLHDPKTQKRDWLPTILWSVSMDALAFGSIFLVLSGLYMWFQQRSKRRSGCIALGIGLVACSFFVFGLARLF